MEDKNYSNKILPELGKLLNLKYNYSSEIPRELLVGTMVDDKYKVRSSWWSMLNDEIENIKDYNLIPECLIKEADMVINTRSDNAKKHKRTQEQDIISVEILLDEIINELEYLHFKNKFETKNNLNH